jgi:hypothetical protein
MPLANIAGTGLMSTGCTTMPLPSESDNVDLFVGLSPNLEIK